MNTVTIIDVLTMVLASSGSGASALLWGRWGPPALFLSTAVLALVVALGVDLLTHAMGAPGGHEAFWLNLMVIEWGCFLWWLIAAPSIIVAVALRAIRNHQLSRRAPAGVAPIAAQN